MNDVLPAMVRYDTIRMQADADPVDEQTIPLLVRTAGGRYGDRSAIEDGPVSLSFAELARAGLHAARAFLAAGIEPGDRVAVWAPNIHEWILAAIGLQSAGAVLVPLNTRFKRAERYLYQALFFFRDFTNSDSRSAVAIPTVDNHSDIN